MRVCRQWIGARRRVFLGGLRRCGDLADAGEGGLGKLLSRCCAGNRLAENKFGLDEFEGQEI